MRIDDLNRSPQSQAAEKADQAAQTRALEKDTKTGSGTDQADVSQLAQALRSPDPRSPDPRRLEQLGLDVQSGHYNVPAEAVAKAIIDAHLKEG